MSIKKCFTEDKAESINLFFCDADLSLGDSSPSQSFFYYETFKPKSFVDLVSSTSFSDLQINKASYINSKQKALRDLVEAAAAPYLNE